MKAKDRTKQACERAIKRYAEKQRKEKEYWNKKIEEQTNKTKTLLNYKRLKFGDENDTISNCS